MKGGKININVNAPVLCAYYSVSTRLLYQPVMFLPISLASLPVSIIPVYFSNQSRFLTNQSLDFVAVLASLSSRVLERRVLPGDVMCPGSTQYNTRVTLSPTSHPTPSPTTTSTTTATRHSLQSSVCAPSLLLLPALSPSLSLSFLYRQEGIFPFIVFNLSLSDLEDHGSIYRN